MPVSSVITCMQISHNFCDGSSQSGLAVVNVTDGTDV